MERHYDVTVVNENSVLTNEKFNANFNDESIEIILEYFKITYDIDYSINKNNILISN